MMLPRLYLTQIFQSLSTVVSSLIGIDCVLLQLFNKGKLDVISFDYRTSTTKERELYYLSCTPRIRKFRNKIRTQ